MADSAAAGGTFEYLGGGITGKFLEVKHEIILQKKKKFRL